MRTLSALDGPGKDANPSPEQTKADVNMDEEDQGIEFLDDGIRMNEQPYGSKPVSESE